MSDFRKIMMEGMKRSAPTMATPSKAVGAATSVFSSGSVGKAPAVYNPGVCLSPLAASPGPGRGAAPFPFRDIRLAVDDTSMPPPDLFGDGGAPRADPRTRVSRPFLLARGPPLGAAGHLRPPRRPMTTSRWLLEGVVGRRLRPSARPPTRSGPDRRFRRWPRSTLLICRL